MVIRFPESVGKALDPAFSDSLMCFPSRCFLVSITAAPVVTVGKPERLLCRLFQAAVEIIKKSRRRLPLPISTAAAVSTGPAAAVSNNH
jgi:hypothetical protein